MSEIVVDNAVTVEAELNYLVADGARPVSYAYDPPDGKPRRGGVYRGYRVPVANARVAPPPGGPSLERNGFELHASRSALTNFSDTEAIESIYYRESEALLKRLTGAKEAVIFDHTLRDGTHREEGHGVRVPVRYVHNDQTFVSGPRRVRDHLPPERAQQWLEGRIAIVNLWRPLSDVESSPLAMCDARSIALTDLVTSDLVYRDKVGETYAFVFNPQHRWYYFPRMTQDEIVLLKIYDSAGGSTARFTAHTAFDDPTSAGDAPPRRSIELRILLRF